MCEPLGIAKPMGTMKVKARSPSLHATVLASAGAGSMVPFQSLATERRQSACAETRKMVNYS